MTDTCTEQRTGTGPAAAAGKTIGGGLLFTLALMMGLASFGIDLYLPAFPAMTRELSTSATGVQLSLTAFLIGAGAGQLVFGPWSDRAGRLLPLLFGAVLFVAASLTAVVAGTIELLVSARLLQGLAGAAGMVIGRAIILDRASGAAAARALSLMMLIGGVAPIIAPIVGGALAEPIGWRGLLGIVAGLGMLALVCALAFVRESLPRDIRAQRAESAEPGRWKGLLSRAYLGNLAAYAFGMAIMMAYISASPFVYQDMIGLSSAAYGIAFAVNAVGMMAATTVAARLAGRFSLRALTRTGLIISLAAVAVIVALSLSSANAVWLMVPLFLAIAPLGLVFGNATALAMSAVPSAATGSGSAILGAVQFALAGVVAGLVGIAGESTAVPLGLVMLGCALIALGGLILAQPRSRDAQTT
ncbi:Bcr/CflA family efflux MFS transporter [Kocuria soli]|uniref:Bcr/CflA family efflux MFS transporter n=1 Tax=Kocuria soli TaxID=2485125 RepID=A0A3N3ZU53_9MICC|nr:multidrug effflux MFS transporter [Kocuria soli]ROZ63778.1 Bcr/CflA family efflux MFS transporter [Kocuria soli]